MTNETAKTIMRWVIVLTLFGMVIYQNNRIAELKNAVISMTRLSIGLHQELEETVQQYDALAKACLNQ